MSACPPIIPLLRALRTDFRLQVRRADVTSAWSGIRPLAVDPKAMDTASALRDHIVVKDDDGLITITGELLTASTAHATF